MAAAPQSVDRVLPSASIIIGRGLLYLIFAVVIVSVTWASITRVNVVVSADGRLVPRSEPVRLSVPQGGIVSAVLVEVGGQVSAGQPILQIDSFQQSAQAAKVSHELEEARSEAARYAKSAARFDDAADDIQREIASEEAVLKSLEQEAGALRTGYQQGAVSLFELQAKQRDVGETRTRVLSLRSELSRSVEESERNRRMASETNERIKSLEIELSRATEEKRKTVLAAPSGGTITYVESMRPGRYLAPNEVAATILPGGEPLLAEIWIPNASMRRVRPSLPVRLKLKAYPYQQFGLLPGTLLSVDPDANPQGAYRAWVRPDRATMNGARGPEPLRPGLDLTAEIVVDQRTVIAVILDPFQRLRRGFAVAG